MGVIRFFAATLVLALFCAVAPATAGQWTVKRVSAPAVYTVDGKTWNKVVRGMEMPKVAWINTGGGGRVLLLRDKDTMLVNSRSLVAVIEKGSNRRPVTDLRQRSGSVTVDVTPRNYDQMTVSTPYMAAVVKGTKFTVSSARGKSALQVQRGLVEVRNLKSGARARVGAGGKAEITAAASASISLTGTNTTALTAATANGNAY